MVERVAIVRLSAIGDVVHGLPLARSLRRVLPGAEITWIVQPGPAPLLTGHPWVDRTLLFPRRGGISEQTRFLLSLGRHGFDLAVDLQGNLKSGLVLAATRAPRRVGPARADYREVPGALAANERAEPAGGPHSVDRTLALCRSIGDEAPRPEFALSPTGRERRAAAQALSALSDPVAALSVGGAGDVREWPDEAWVEAARGLARDGASVLVLAGPEHAARGAAVAARAGVTERCGRTDLRGLLADLSVLADRRALLVACDSAPLHLAVAVGLPVLALSGPQDPARTGPYGFADRALTRWEGLDCAPCLKRSCRLETEPRACMTRIGPGEVVRRARDLLGL